MSKNLRNALKDPNGEFYKFLFGYQADCSQEARGTFLAELDCAIIAAEDLDQEDMASELVKRAERIMAGVHPGNYLTNPSLNFIQGIVERLEIAIDNR